MAVGGFSANSERESLKIAVAYDRLGTWPQEVAQPVDLGSEYEDERTIEALLEAIAAHGHEAEGVVLAPDFVQAIIDAKPDLVFNIAEGVRGRTRESLVPAVLEHIGVAYTGSDGLALAISLDKGLTKTLALSQGIRTPEFRTVRSEADLVDLDLPYPLFVKPNAEGSSMGICDASLVETASELTERVAHVLREYRKECLVEVFAPGREFCVGVLGNGKPEVLPIAEVRTETAFYTQQEKNRHHKELVCPAALPPEVAEEMRWMTIALFTMLQCRDLARVDFRLDGQGRPALLEINPLPGLSPHYSIYPHQAAQAGISYEDLIGRIIAAASSRIIVREGRISL